MLSGNPGTGRWTEERFENLRFTIISRLKRDKAWDDRSNDPVTYTHDKSVNVASKYYRLTWNILLFLQNCLTILFRINYLRPIGKSNNNTLRPTTKKLVSKNFLTNKRVRIKTRSVVPTSRSQQINAVSCVCFTWL